MTKVGCTILNSSLGKNVRTGRANLLQSAAGNVMLIGFFNNHHLFYQHYVTPKTTLNKEYYRDVLGKLYSHISQKQPELKQIWILQDNNAQPRRVQLINHYLASKVKSTPCIMWVLAVPSSGESSMWHEFCDGCWGQDFCLKNPRGNSFGGINTLMIKRLEHMCQLMLLKKSLMIDSYR